MRGGGACHPCCCASSSSEAHCSQPTRAGGPGGKGPPAPARCGGFLWRDHSPSQERLCAAARAGKLEAIESCLRSPADIAGNARDAARVFVNTPDAVRPFCARQQNAPPSHAAATPPPPSRRAVAQRCGGRPHAATGRRGQPAMTAHLSPAARAVGWRPDPSPPTAGAGSRGAD